MLEIDDSPDPHPAALTEPAHSFSEPHYPHDCDTHYSNIADTMGEQMVRTMVKRGIKRVFGPVARDDLHISHALHTQENSNNLNYYGIHREGAAAFACSSYGKLTKRPAVCLATTRQGAAKFSSGLRDARIDRSPVLVLIERLATDGINLHPLATGKTTTPTQWSQTLTHGSNPTQLMNMACTNAILNSAVSQLSFSRHILSRPCDSGAESSHATTSLPSLKIEPPRDALRNAIRRLRASETPVIVVGQGARDCMENVIMLAEQLRAAVLTTFKGKGLISDHHSLAGGVLGKHGIPVAQALLEEADTILVFGANLDSHHGTIPNKPIIQVDHDLQALARSEGVEVPVWGEISVTARALSDEFLGDMWTTDQTKSISRHWSTWRAQKQRELDQQSYQATPAQLFSHLSAQVNHDAIVVIDAAIPMDVFGRYFECAEQSVIMPADPHTVGFALPAAIGAWVATQEEDERLKGRQVVVICDVAEHEAFQVELSSIAGGTGITVVSSRFFR